MAARKLPITAGLLLLGWLLPAAANPWGDLKKIYFHEASGNRPEVRRSLARLDAQGLAPGDKAEIVGQLIALGDRRLQAQDDALARDLYLKALKISPGEAWPVYNKLERIGRRQGRITWSLANVVRQLGRVLRDFSGALLLLGGLFNVLPFSGLLLFFLLAAALAVRTVKLAAHDFILQGGSRFRIERLPLLLLLLFWPLLLAGGWAFYPFLFCGLLWGYFSHDERQIVRRLQLLLLALALFHAVGRYLERSLVSPGFQTVQQVYAGRLFPASAYGRFDNELKVMQAYAYRNAGKPDEAMDILLDTGSAYATPLKFTLLGDLHVEKGNLPQAIQFYRQSLSLDDRNPVTLANFTFALLQNDDPDLFLFYGKNYPQINRLKDKAAALQRNRPPQKLLWRRLLNFSWQRFHPWHFLEVVGVEFLRFPILPALLLMAAYAFLLRRLAPALGQSVFCSRCGKIIRKLAIEQVQSHALCEECYQLFLIKDPIFLEAKLIKEKEIGRQAHVRQALLLGASLIVPGFLLNFRGQIRVFATLFFLFASVLGLFWVNAANFRGVFGTAPMFLNLVGLAALALYLVIAALTLRAGGSDGL